MPSSEALSNEKRKTVLDSRAIGGGGVLLCETRRRRDAGARSSLENAEKLPGPDQRSGQ